MSHGKDAGKTSKEQEHEKLMPNEPHHHRRHHEIYNFVYILHPKAVTGFSWRQKSRQMPLYVVDVSLFSKWLFSCSVNNLEYYVLFMGVCPWGQRRSPPSRLPSSRGDEICPFECSAIHYHHKDLYMTWYRNNTFGAL